LNDKILKLDNYLKKSTIFFMYVFVIAMPFKIGLTQTSLGLALLSWLGRIIVTRQVKLQKISLEWAFAVFIASVILSLFFSTNVTQSFIFLKRLLLIPIVYLMALNTDDKKLFERIAILFVISVTIYSLSGIFSFISNPTLRVRHIQNSMTAGGITMIGSLAALALAIVLKNMYIRIAFTLMCIFNLVCLVLTSTRGSWLGFLFGALLIIYYTNKKLIIALIVLLPIIYFFGPENFSQRVQHMFDPTWRTNAKRLAWWSVGWEIFKDHPLVGVGDVSTNKIYEKYAPPGTKELIGHFHSNYVHIAVTLGGIGLLAFLFMIINIYIKLLCNFKKCAQDGIFKAWALAALSIFLAFNINGFFEWNYGDAEIITIIWFATGLALTVSRIKNAVV